MHRLRTVFETVGLPPTEAMIQREQRLQAMAALVRSGGAEPAPARARVTGGRAATLATAA